jgi:hypothetical protein
LNKLTIVLVLSLVCIIVIGCGVDKHQADNLVNQYFEAIKENDFNQATSLYSEKFFETTPREKAIQMLNVMQSKYGDLISYKQTKWSIVHSNGDENHPKGNSYIFQYELIYTKYTVYLDITLFQPDKESTMMIQGYNIKSSTLNN